MKKIIMLALAAALIGGAVPVTAATSEDQKENSDAYASLLAQVQAFKKANTGVSEDTAPAQQQDGGENKPQQDAEPADASTNEAKPAEGEAAAVKEEENKAPEEKGEAAPAEGSAQKKNPSASEMDKIVKEEAEKAAKAQEEAENNRGVVEPQKAESAAPSDDVKPEEAKPEEAKPAPADEKKEVKEEAPASAPEAQPAPAEEKGAKQEEAKDAAPAPEAKPAESGGAKQEEAAAPAVQPAPQASAGEIPAGRPLNPSPMKEGAHETKETLLVSAEWLKANRGNVILVDSRPESLYAGGHIPGAVNAPWTYFANTNAQQGSEKWGTIWPAATMAKRIGALGINGKKTVVAYCDAGGWGQSGWTLWILRQAGIKNAKMLDGGIGAWKAIGGQITKNKNTNKNVAFTIKEYSPNYRATTEWINNNLGKPGLVLLDVRTDSEFLGKIAPFQEKRRGHLPGAINIPREAFLGENSGVKTEADLQALLASKGVTPDCEIVVYDTAGVRSAFVTMLLRGCGFKKSQSYDAGFQAWAGNPELPLIKP